VHIVTKGMFRGVFFLLRLVDSEGVRMMKCSRGGYENTISVGASRCRMLEGGNIGKGKEIGEGAFERVLQVELEGIAKCINWKGDCIKDAFDGVLKFRGHKVSHRVEIVKSSEARRDKIVNVEDKTRGNCRPWDMYARWGVIPSISIIISV
jgi:hypothetical protein